MSPIATLARRIRLMSARAVVKLVNDGLNVQGLQLGILANEVSDVQRFQEYGFTSVPQDGAEAVVLSIAGVRSHGIVVATEDGRYRLKNLKQGEVALYTDEGDSIHFKRGKIIAITSGSEVDVTAPTVKVTATSKVTFDTPELHCTGKITADDDISSSTDVLAAGISGKNHVHADPQGGVVGPPQ